MDMLATVWQQPTVPSMLIVSALMGGLMLVFGVLSLLTDDVGLGSRRSMPQLLFALYTRWGRFTNAVLAPYMRMTKRYPLANTCQIPFFSNLSDLYKFVFGYRTTGIFVEIGAYDGESFSNTSGLADLGWTGHYVEPIPRFAKATSNRHKSNKNVTVHNICAGERDGDVVELSQAGPFTSAVADEIASVSGSELSKALEVMGWAHSASEAGKEKAEGGAARARSKSVSRDSKSTTTTAPAAASIETTADGKIKATTVSLNTFFTQQRIAPGAVDVMVVDVEGFEWPILRAFNIAKYKPKLAIVEIQSLQARYRSNERVQADAHALDEYFRSNGYHILYRDVVNTVFIHKEVQCQGGA